MPRDHRLYIRISEDEYNEFYSKSVEYDVPLSVLARDAMRAYFRIVSPEDYNTIGKPDAVAIDYWGYHQRNQALIESLETLENLQGDIEATNDLLSAVLVDKGNADGELFDALSVLGTTEERVKQYEKELNALLAQTQSERETALLGVMPMRSAKRRK